MAEKAQHTPGPWHYNQELSLHTRQLVYGSDKYLVADAGGIYRRTEKEAIANARLIAAGPDLLEAGQEVLDAWGDGDLAGAVRKLDAAIAKATGGN